jgi:hypothetical protein
MCIARFSLRRGEQSGYIVITEKKGKEGSTKHKNNTNETIYAAAAAAAADCFSVGRQYKLLPPSSFIRRGQTRHGFPNYTLITNSSYVILFVVMTV